MRPTPSLIVEDARVAALAEYDLVNSAPAPGFTQIVALAARLFEVPIAVVSLIDRDRQVFHAKVGVASCETDREIAICSHTIMQTEALVVLDATLDPRFHDNPFVTGPSQIRFYAGIPLRTPAGHAIGTLCLADTRTRNTFSDADRETLRQLADLTVDRMELRRLEVAQRASQSRFEQIASTSPDGIICADASGRITFWNAAAEQIFGHGSTEAIGQSIDLIVPERMRGGHGGGLHRVANGGKPRLVGKTIELPARHKDGTEFPIELSLSKWQEEGRAAFGSIVRDIRERRANEERLFRLAHLDPLTELPNRSVLRERLDEIATVGRPVSVLMLDLDGFKEVNDSYGHGAGDSVLRVMATRILACVRPIDTVSRLGGDEFVVLLPDIGDPLRAAEVAGTIIAAVAEAVEYDGQALRLSASLGIAMAPSHGNNAGELLGCADLALYQAKSDGRHCHRLFSPVLRHQAQRARVCRDELGRAVERGEFVLFYQPQVRLSDGALVGAEALIRWQHPDRGLLSPAAFIDVLDSSRYAAQVGDWVLRTACIQAEAWRSAGALDFRMGINLCTAQFQRGDLTETVRATLSDTGLPAASLELEITENIVLRQEIELIATLHSLRESGVGIAFDDYGTGYASLSLLKRFPLTRLKIDRSFVTGMLASHHDVTIVRAILQLGLGFGLSVIAEGIETEAEHACLRTEGCQEGQGYLFGKPMPADAFAAGYGLGVDASWALARRLGAA
ncbi:EAL domain-containing protein [Methylobacterium sp. WL30]|uniref:putative bifunctional diguanylate cyclase/phosphodiesterase n=1 Tax=Methylobacterium sp. WL93 TaxID=2603892 RepID=UPI0011C8D490|nr:MULTISPECIES: EAL domain-containing protein [unclassified Methylobacterium]TXN39959.1 EAL domain-containing protein [Methylobacterium sp. WL93]TXN46806.1 EAL domain-containing protein [Methylobacterium sp. WL119]TXN62247.1 EAL domain-containing protein [Methylobacterium sp. WL30]